ncbi:hypothetical protein AACB27_37035, partial [Burkholderia contaminans]|uniref:hypothetical protein n=1 Tax=Burkholderia contaminans TaxID=488447 RepID=UPI003114505B
INLFLRLVTRVPAQAGFARNGPAAGRYTNRHRATRRFSWSAVIIRCCSASSRVASADGLATGLPRPHRARD